MRAQRNWVFAISPACSRRRRIADNRETLRVAFLLWGDMEQRTYPGYETEQEIQMKTQNRRLMWHGMLLLLFGLITGLLEQRFTNVRMGLSAHLEGVMNGILLLALGAAWNEVRLSRPVK